MKATAPVYVIDDDPDDHSLVEEIWIDLGLKNELLFFTNAAKAISYLETIDTVPLLIICDVNIPGTDGFELRKILMENPSLRYKTVPFVYWSNTASKQQIQKAYDLNAHGFFIKDNNFEDLKRSLVNIITYWIKSEQPEI